MIKPSKISLFILLSAGYVSYSSDINAQYTNNTGKYQTISEQIQDDKSFSRQQKGTLYIVSSSNVEKREIQPEPKIEGTNVPESEVYEIDSPQPRQLPQTRNNNIRNPYAPEKAAPAPMPPMAPGPAPEPPPMKADKPVAAPMPSDDNVAEKKAQQPEPEYEQEFEEEAPVESNKQKAKPEVIEEEEVEETDITQEEAIESKSKYSKENPPKMNTGMYVSILLGMPLSSGFNEKWPAGMEQYDRTMSLRNFADDASFFGGFRLGYKADFFRLEAEGRVDRFNYEYNAGYTRAINSEMFGANAVFDVADFVLRPYVGVGIGFANMEAKNTNPLGRDAKAKTSTTYYKGLAGISFNIPGGNLFGEISYRMFNTPDFAVDGGVCSPVNPAICGGKVSFDSMDSLDVAVGFSFYF